MSSPFPLFFFFLPRPNTVPSTRDRMDTGDQSNTLTGSKNLLEAVERDRSIPFPKAGCCFVVMEPIHGYNLIHFNFPVWIMISLLQRGDSASLGIFFFPDFPNLTPHLVSLLQALLQAVILSCRRYPLHSGSLSDPSECFLNFVICPLGK